MADRFDLFAYTGKGVRVALVDSGINPQHSHVKWIEGGIGIIPEGEGQVTFTDDFGDRLGHGTANAGILRKKAPDVQLYGIKVFDSTLATSVQVLIEAIRWAVDHGVKVVNLSLGTTNRANAPGLKEICDYAAEKGVILVAAGEDGKEVYPAVFPNVIGATMDPTSDEYTYVHWYGDPVEFGTCGWPRRLPGVPQRSNFRGNSFAATHMSGFI
ncbi:MAG: S8 family serine peptidase, partial [candidate division NC10 bacterium]|nr:S8 family serine peptidase [candidate division NC10 bacterium]